MMTPAGQCPSCGSRWGGLIPRGHRVSCPEAGWNKPKTADCQMCSGSGARPPKVDPQTGRGTADDCGHCAGTGVITERNDR